VLDTSIRKLYIQITLIKHELMTKQMGGKMCWTQAYVNYKYK